jgi:N-methylhydantoinase B
MTDGRFPSWGEDNGKNVGGGWLPSLSEVRKYEKLEPVEFDILSHRLYSIINEARQAVMRVSGSQVVAEGGEAMFAVYDAYGWTSSLACGLLLHVIGTEGFMREILELQSEFPGIFEGDVFMYNEPSIGGIHACDQWSGTPIFYEGELIGWLGSLTHTAETGAIEPGGMPPSSRSLLHEGYRVQGLKLMEKGRLNKAVQNSVLRATRDPAYYTLDMRARVAGLNVARERIAQLITRYGVKKIKALMQQNMDSSEEQARAKLKSVADGTWRAVNFGDWDIGPEPKFWKVALTATKEKDELTLDFSGTSEANKGPVNCMIWGTWGNIFVAIASQLFWEIPGNAGMIRPLKLIAPEGSLVNVQFLSPCVMCPPMPGHHISNVVTTIIAKMYYTNKKYWGDINAPWVATSWVGAFWGGMTQHGYMSAGMFGDSWARGTGAGIDEGRGDGCDTGAFQMTVESCIPDVEMNELMYPFLYLWRREEMDTAAPGRWRGGASVSFAVVPHNTPSVTIAFRGTGKYAQQGQSLDGAYPPSFGRSGSVAIVELNHLKEEMAKGAKPDNVEDFKEYIAKTGGQFWYVNPFEPSQPITQDDVILSLNCGGGGVGDPLDREPSRVVADLGMNIFSMEMAREIFGVVVDQARGEVDEEATRIKREEIRARRRERGKVWEGPKE